MRVLALWLTLLALLVAACVPGCGDSSVPSPFGKDAGSDGDASGSGGGDAQADADPLLGGPCVDDAQCDDGIACTFDACDQEISRCRFTPDDKKCQDSVYCDGLEVCDAKLGCREGEPVTCSDNDTCTIDTCLETTQSCDHVPRDIDQDGDPDAACGGGDCDDTNPLVSGLRPEVCGNGIDDDCNGAVDETGCVSPEHDTCVDPLEIDKSGVYSLSLVATQSDYSASCAGSGGAWRDAVAALIVPAGGPVDIDVVAQTEAGQVALAGFGQCGDLASELACGGSSPLPQSGQMARVRLRSLAPGAYPLVVFGTADTAVSLTVKVLPPTTKPDNETCGTAKPIAPGVHQTLPIIDAAQDLAGECSASTGELVYSITLTSPMDVHAYGVSLDGYGAPTLTLWQAPCSSPGQELACSSGKLADAFVRAAGPGTVYLAVAATAPTDLDVVVELSPPSTPAPDETCVGSPALVPGQTVDVPLADHTDDIKLGCQPGAVDAAYSLDLSAASDVLLVGRLSDTDTAAVAISKPGCAGPSDAIACQSSQLSPVRTSAHALAPGSYRAVAESTVAGPMQLTAFVRPASVPTLVPFADTCDKAVLIPPSGGFFQGNTANANADYDCGCDYGGLAPGGAPEQMLKLVLTAKKRVIFDMQGSGYSTLLQVRKGPSCPGQELSKACAAGYYASRSFLDLTLDAGEYLVQVDGYAGDSGPWFLDVFTADP